MWTWKCTRCGAQFPHVTKEAALAAFNEHAVTAHNAKIVLSMEGDTDD